MKYLRKNSILYDIYKATHYILFKRHIYGLTSSLRVLPDFIVIGVVRGGTTSIYHYLGQHNCIRKSAYDELGFFDDNYHLGLNWYRSMFPTRFIKNRIIKKYGKFMTYEVTPFYIYNPKVVQRIYDILPKIKVIAVLRNPVDRAYSNYYLGVRSNDEKRTFEDAIDSDLKKIQDTSNDDYFGQMIDKSYIARGFYSEQLQIWMDKFPKEQLLVISSEDLARKTDDTLAIIFDFLKLPNYKIRDLTKRNEAKYPPMNQDTRKMLVDYFRPHNEKLYSLLGRKFDWDK